MRTFNWFWVFVAVVLASCAVGHTSPQHKEVDGCMRISGLEERTDCLFELLLKHPDSVYALFTLAQERDKHNELQRFLSELNRLIEMRPNLAHLFLLRADIKERIGDMEGAKEDRETGNKLELIEDVRRVEAEAETKMESADAEDFVRRARARYFQGNYKGAIEDCEAFFELEPNSCLAAGYKYLVNSLERIGNVEEAITVLTKELETCPQNSMAVYTRRARLKRLLGDEAGARIDEENAKVAAQ